jgi:RHS repeat-associated protein
VQAINAPSATMDLRFPGQLFQLETGLHYNWHRHYDPKTGRYLQPDPLGFVCVSTSISLSNDLEPGKWVKIERLGDAEDARRNRFRIDRTPPRSSSR